MTLIEAEPGHATHIPVHDAEASAKARPRPVAARTLDDWLCIGGSFIGSLCLTWLLYDILLPTEGSVGFAICWYLSFVLLYAVVTALSQPRPLVIDRIVSAVVQGAAGLVGGVIVWTVSTVFVRGWPAVHHLNFFTHDMFGVAAATAPLNRGGIYHAIVGSGIEVGISLAISVPLGLATAVYLAEVGGRMARVVRTVVEAMTALPDLIAGLFVLQFYIITLHYETSGFAAAMALAITMTPIIARSCEVSLRLVPGGLREASLALGSSQLRTVWSVVIPTALPGLMTAFILSIARGIGETAPVLITSGASTIRNYDPFHKDMNSLPLYIYEGVRSGQPLAIQRAYGAAAVLLIIVIVLFTALRLVSRGKASR